MSETSDERAKRIIDRCERFSDFVRLPSGDVYFHPEMSEPLTSFDLRVIADELDRRNEERNKCDN